MLAVLCASMRLFPLTAAVRGQSGRSFAHLHQNPTLAGKPQKQAVRALLERLGAIHQSTCPCTRIPEVRRCNPLERRLIIALAALARGASVDQAIAVAGSFGVLGSVEVQP